MMQLKVQLSIIHGGWAIRIIAFEGFNIPGAQYRHFMGHGPNLLMTAMNLAVNESTHSILIKGIL